MALPAWNEADNLETVIAELRGDHLRIDPCIPKAWPGFQITYQKRGPQGRITSYEITVENARRVCQDVTRVELDGNGLAATDAIALADDGLTHSLRVVLG